jgi:hypothetical protein
MDVMVFCKSRPAAPKVLLTVAIIPYLHLVRDTTARLLAEYRLSQFAPIHELGEIQWQALNLAALRHSNAEEREDLGRNSRSSRRRSDWTWSSANHFGFILAAKWAAGTTLSWSVR